MFSFYLQIFTIIVNYIKGEKNEELFKINGIIN